MKNIAEFKRRMTVVSLWEGTYQQRRENKNVGSIKDFGIRKCGKSNSVGFAFETQAGNLSHCDWPKKAEFSSIGDIVKIKNDYCVLIYIHISEVSYDLR